jgi:hypothetical protein
MYNNVLKGLVIETHITVKWGYMLLRDQPLWKRDNLHAFRERMCQIRFVVSFCAGIVGYIVVGSCLLPDRLTAQRYLHVLETVLPGMLEDVPSSVRQRLYGFSTMELQRSMGKV